MKSNMTLTWQEVAEKYGLTLNESMCVYRVMKIELLGYEVETVRANL